MKKRDMRKRICALFMGLVMVLTTVNWAVAEEAKAETVNEDTAVVLEQTPGQATASGGSGITKWGDTSWTFRVEGDYATFTFDIPVSGKYQLIHRGGAVGTGSFNVTVDRVPFGAITLNGTNVNTVIDTDAGNYYFEAGTHTVTFTYAETTTNSTALYLVTLKQLTSETVVALQDHDKDSVSTTAGSGYTDYSTDNANGYIAFWNTQTVTFTDVNIPESGTYGVYVDGGSGGDANYWEVAINGQSVSDIIPNTGGVSAISRKKLGSIDLDEGNFTLQMKAGVQGGTLSMIRVVFIWEGVTEVNVQLKTAEPYIVEADILEGENKTYVKGDEVRVSGDYTATYLTNDSADRITKEVVLWQIYDTHADGNYDVRDLVAAKKSAARQKLQTKAGQIAATCLEVPSDLDEIKDVLVGKKNKFETDIFQAKGDMNQTLLVDQGQSFNTVQAYGEGIKLVPDAYSEYTVTVEKEGWYNLDIGASNLDNTVITGETKDAYVAILVNSETVGGTIVTSTSDKNWDTVKFFDCDQNDGNIWLAKGANSIRILNTTADFNEHAYNKTIVLQYVRLKPSENYNGAVSDTHRYYFKDYTASFRNFSSLDHHTEMIGSRYTVMREKLENLRYEIVVPKSGWYNVIFHAGVGAADLGIPSYTLHVNSQTEGLTNTLADTGDYATTADHEFGKIYLNKGHNTIRVQNDTDLPSYLEYFTLVLEEETVEETTSVTMNMFYVDEIYSADRQAPTPAGVGGEGYNTGNLYFAAITNSQKSWADYTINVSKEGWYDVQLGIAAGYDNKFKIEVNGEVQNNWVFVSTYGVDTPQYVGQIYLTEGGNKLRIYNETIYGYQLGQLTIHESSEPQVYTVELGDIYTIDEAENEYKQFPFMWKLGDALVLAISEHSDTYESHPTDSILISRDNGKTWGERLRTQDIALGSMIQRKDGQWFGVNYQAYYIDEYNAEMYYWTSDDDGKTWEKHTGKVHSEKALADSVGGGWASFGFHRSLFEMPDGSLQGTAYGTYAGDKHFTTFWVKSEDGGANWEIVSEVGGGGTITVEGEESGLCETVVARCADDSLLAVSRTIDRKPVYQSRSYDNGLTWSKPEQLPGVILPQDAHSVAPDLQLLSDGTLVLTTGRDGLRMLVSLDGCGYEWERSSITLYDKYTSGYSAIQEIEPGKLLLVCDMGSSNREDANAKAAIWGRYIYLNRQTTENTDKKVKLRIPNTELILNEAGTNTIVWAIDGDKRYTSLEEYEMEYVIEDESVLSIDESGKITALKKGTTGVSVKVTNGTDTLISNKVTVRVIVPTSVIDFDSDTVGNAPVGYTSNLVTVSSDHAYSGTNSIRFHDNSASAMANFKINGKAKTVTRSVEFKMYPVDLTNGISIPFFQDNAYGNFVYNTYIANDGSVKCYGSNKWNDVLPAGTIKMNEWNSVQISVDASTKIITIIANGTTATFTGTTISSTGTMGLAFGSGSTVGVNCDVYLDDITIEEGVVTN